jgi:hypothetical protein
MMVMAFLVKIKYTKKGQAVKACPKKHQPNPILI